MMRLFLQYFLYHRKCHINIAYSSCRALLVKTICRREWTSLVNNKIKVVTYHFVWW